MRSRQPSFHPMHRRLPAILVLTVAGAMGLILVMSANASASASQAGAGQSGPPMVRVPNKAQQINAEIATQQAMAREYGPSKKVPLAATQWTPPASCPVPAGSSGISLPDGTVHVEDILNLAVIAPTPSNPYKYMIYAGATWQSPHQGILFVWRSPDDPCAAKYRGTDTMVTYETPYQKGALTITGINNDSVSFSISDGGTGQFNYITDTFS